MSSSFAGSWKPHSRRISEARAARCSSDSSQEDERQATMNGTSISLPNGSSILLASSISHRRPPKPRALVDRQEGCASRASRWCGRGESRPEWILNWIAIRAARRYTGRCESKRKRACRKTRISGRERASRARRRARQRGSRECDVRARERRACRKNSATWRVWASRARREAAERGSHESDARARHGRVCRKTSITLGTCGRVERAEGRASADRVRAMREQEKSGE